MEDEKAIELEIKKDYHGRRLDKYLHARFSNRTRSFWQKQIEAGNVLVNGARAKPSSKILAGDTIRIRGVPLAREKIVGEPMSLEIIYEDEYILALNKAPGVVVHPARGHQRGTLVHGVAYHVEKLAQTGYPLRPGVVHRLDKNTTGVILFIKDERIHHKIARQFEQRKIKKEYIAVATGKVAFDSDYIDKPLGKHKTDRTRMQVRRDDGKEALSFYQVEERFKDYTLLSIYPRTGRTHQIRVHLASLKHPLAGDREYGGKCPILLKDITGTPQDEEILIERQALHARRITFFYEPIGKELTLEAPLPDDMRRLVEALRRYQSIGRD